MISSVIVCREPLLSTVRSPSILRSRCTALYARRSFRMGAGELVRLVLGFSILPLLFHHFFAGRYVYSAFGVDRRYDVVLTAYFWFVPFWGWRQVTVLLVAWTHGCLGVHYWLRARSNYHRFAPILLTVATLLPVLALLGLWQGTQQIFQQWQLHPDLLQMTVRDGHMRDPAIGGRSWNLEVQLYWIYVGLLSFVFVAWAARWLVERRRGLINIAYPGGRVVRVPIGCAVLDASRRASIPHAAICGGRGRCTTCRVRVLRGVERLPPPSASEQALLSRLHAGPSVRLACQLRPRSDTAVLPRQAGETLLRLWTLSVSLRSCLWTSASQQLWSRSGTLMMWCSC